MSVKWPLEAWVLSSFHLCAYEMVVKNSLPAVHYTDYVGFCLIWRILRVIYCDQFLKLAKGENDWNVPWDFEYLMRSINCQQIVVFNHSREDLKRTYRVWCSSGQGLPQLKSCSPNVATPNAKYKTHFDYLFHQLLYYYISNMIEIKILT